MQTHIQSREVILLMLDISGYTKFMLANRKEQHSQLVIANILRKIIDDVKLPLRVAKLEGDAVFLYAVKRHDHLWPDEKKIIGNRLEDFFAIFARELVRLSGSELCQGNQCKNLNKLRLKVFVHSGEALFQTIRGFEEISGVDVIEIHQLLKNSVPAHHYILITQKALHDINFPHRDELYTHIENTADFGKVKTYVYIPPEPAACLLDASAHSHTK